MLTYMSSAFNWIGNQAFGRHAPRAIILMAVSAAMAAVILAVLMLQGAGHEFGWWQWLIIGIVAFDIGGGVVANATSAAARQYHRPDRPWEPLVFAAAHVHPFAMALLLPGYTWVAGATLYTSVILAVGATLLTPRDLRRPAALFFSAVTIALCGLVTGAGWEWLAPLLILKLVAAHATLGSSQ
jgi:hypothetical protein